MKRAGRTPVETAERKAFYARIDKQNMTPLWTVLGQLITPEPKSACVPACWHFEDIRKAMLDAGTLITAEQAERRVLVLENPGMRGQSKITTSLFAGVQLIMPREVARAHRHSQSALRFVLDGEGAHTSVNGERTRMAPGDFIITPYMACACSAPSRLFVALTCGKSTATIGDAVSASLHWIGGNPFSASAARSLSVSKVPL
jgi:gentisate 1,2-dioxygenase